MVVFPADIQKEEEIRIRVSIERAAGRRRAGAVRGGGAHAAVPAAHARAGRHARRGPAHAQEPHDPRPPGSIWRCRAT